MKSNKQTVIYVLTQIIAQGGCSVRHHEADDDGDTSSCMYRGENGRKCAAGHLIPDNEYTPEFEGKNVFHDEIRAILVELEYDFRLVNLLQDIHDDMSNVGDDKAIAKFNLTLEFVNQLDDDEYFVTNLKTFFLKTE